MKLTSSPAGAGKGIGRIREGNGIECAKEEDRPVRVLPPPDGGG
jgi:hypothetical protein